MECERLNRLVRSWYVQVQGEALAPARMVEFMEKHIMDCDVCLTDPDVRYEVKKITAVVLPPSKMIKQPKQDEDEGESEEAPPDKYADDEDDEDSDSDDDESADFDPDLLEDDEDDDED